MDSCTSVNWIAWNKKGPIDSEVSSGHLIIIGGYDNQRKMCDIRKDHGNIGRTEGSLSHKGEKSLQPFKVVASDKVQKNSNNNMTVVVLHIKIKLMILCKPSG